MTTSKQRAPTPNRKRTSQGYIAFAPLLPLTCAVLLVASAPMVQAGMNVWTTHGPYGASVTALAIDPHTPSTLYAGTGGGVFSIQQVATCTGDCDGSGAVGVNEIITLVNIVLGTAQPLVCANGGLPIGGDVTIAVLIQAVNSALNGCALTAEEGCLTSGGTVTTATCCASTSDFPDTCAIGACGCSPNASHAVRVCQCSAGNCFNGTQCVGR